jgi:hypothetical protein
MQMCIYINYSHHFLLLTESCSLFDVPIVIMQVFELGVHLRSLYQ